MKIKEFLINFDMKNMIESSKRFNEYMNSPEILDLQKKIDDELLSMEKEMKAFLQIYHSLDQDGYKYTQKFKEHEALKKKELEERIQIQKEIEEEKKEVMNTFERKLYELKMNLASFDTKNGNYAKKD